ncbi:MULTISPECIES: hypothetical protein [unclassified Achromobacter]|uniref:hypothetical protein n=1 Tax=unclassified Achromobacter TaxID=2626865 RepID=UPI0011787EF5|nr:MULTISPECIES: hypothetical protein [unclassified Achromobacter]
MEYREGEYVARQSPTGRVHLTASIRGWDIPDLAERMDGATLYRTAAADPAFRTLLVRLGWIEGGGPAQESAAVSEEQQSVPSLPEWLGGIEVHAAPEVLNGSPLGGAVDVIMTHRDGQRYRVGLLNLEARDKDALFKHFWHLVPDSIRALADTPDAAHTRYVAAKLRGYLRG